MKRQANISSSKDMLKEAMTNAKKELDLVINNHEKLYFDGGQLVFNQEKQVLSKDNTAWNNIAKFVLFHEKGVEEIKMAINHID